MDYKPSTYFLKIGFKINAAIPEEGQGIIERCSFTIVLYRSCYQWLHYVWPHCVSVNRGFSTRAPGLPQRSKKGMLQDIKGRVTEPILLRAQLGSHLHHHKSMETEMKCCPSFTSKGKSSSSGMLLGFPGTYLQMASVPLAAVPQPCR